MSTMKTKKLQKKDKYVMRIYKGEEFLSEIKEFCAKEGIHSGVFTAIGALEKATLGFFDPGSKEYIKFGVGETEIASCMGNIALREGEVMVHSHAVLSDSAGRCFGGHLFEAYISATSEVFLETFSEKVERIKDEETTLFLLNLK